MDMENMIMLRIINLEFRKRKAEEFLNLNGMNIPIFFLGITCHVGKVEKN